MHPKVKEAAMQMFSDKDDETRNERLEFQRRIRDLKKENKKLKDEKYLPLHAEFMGKTTTSKILKDDVISSLVEENKKLKEELAKVPALLEEERYKERAANERDDADALEMLAEDNEELKEKVKKLKKDFERIGDKLEFEGDTTCEDILDCLDGLFFGEEMLKKNNEELKKEIEGLNEEDAWLVESLKKSTRRIEYYEKYIDEHIDTQEWVNFVEKYSKTDGIVLFGFEGDEESESEEEEECHTDDWNNPCPICKDIMGGIVCNTFGQESCGGCAIKIMKEKQKN